MLKRKGVKEFVRLLGYMKPRMFKYMLGILGMDIAGTALVIMLAFALKHMIDAPIQGQMLLLKKAILLISMIVIIAITAVPIFHYTYKSAIKRTMADIRRKVFRHIQKLPMGFYDENHSGDVISRITNDIQMVEMAYSDQIQTISGTALLGVGSAVFMFILDWRVSIILIFTSVLIIVVNARFAHKIRSISDKVQQHLGLFTGCIIDLVSGFYVMKMFHNENIMDSKLKHHNNDVTKLAVNRVNNSGLLDSTNYFLSMINFAGVMCIGAYLTIKDVTDFGTVTALIQLQMNVNQSFLSLGNSVAQLQGYLAGAGRVFELLDWEIEKEGFEEIEKQNVEDMVCMRDVTFGYDEKKNVLEGLSILVKKGQIAALVGPSGGGKSTIFKLLMGYYPVEKCLIALQGKSLSHYSLEELRNMIAYVPQDSYLFDGTINENIRYGRPSASDEEIIAAAKTAFAHDFIMEFPEGYEKIVGEKGAKLSVGQRQRISIARALLKDAPILLLDEATSALDSDSEQQVQEALKELTKGRTVLVVAHRLSTIENADIIFVIDKGTVKEKGSHDELMERKGLYSSFYNTHFKEEAADREE
ncbi:ABC transporter ATP-binding protein [Wukongibacter sp. M2B1]|uniref:ABC transporter ATP-binding protein n=1 Tax=Wukongibacter sp. M2B1 TaxID=3088895 RepID=UPI003D7B40AF